MNKKPSQGSVVGGIACIIIAIVNFSIALVFSILGAVFLADPYNVNVTINGEELHGEEAAEAAIKIGRVCLGVGIATGVIFVICLIIAIVCLSRASKAKKQMQMNNYYNPVNQGGFNGQMRQNVYYGQNNGNSQFGQNGFNTQMNGSGQYGQSGFVNQNGYNQSGFNNQMNSNSQYGQSGFVNQNGYNQGGFNNQNGYNQSGFNN